MVIVVDEADFDEVNGLMNKIRLTLLCCLMFVFASGLAAAEVGQYQRKPTALAGKAVVLPARPESIAQAIETAIKTKQRRLVIPAGTYRLAPPDHGPVHLVVDGAEDLELVADGVTFVCTRRTRAINLRACRNVTLRGLTIDYDPLTFTQGRVITVAEDKSWIDIRIDAGYPRMPWKRIDLIDPRTRYRKHGMPFLWGTTATMVEPDVVRVSLRRIGEAAAVGDLASLSAGNEAGGVCHGVVLERCAGGMVLEDVTIHCAPGMGIVEGGGDGGTRLSRVRIVPGPKPAGATEDRLLTTSWDGILHASVRRGPTVEQCRIEHCGDDSWSVSAADLLVLKCDGCAAVLAPRSPVDLRPGDRLVTALDAPCCKVTEVRSVARDRAGLDQVVKARLEQAKPWTLWKVGWECLAVRLDREPAWKAGTSVLCPDCRGDGFVFCDNRLHSSGRVLVKAGGGRIEDNVLIDPHGIMVCPEVPPEAAAGIQNLVIRNNHIFQSGYFCPSPWSTQAGAISVTCSGPAEGRRGFRSPAVFENVVIENNTLEQVGGVSLCVTSAKNLLIRDNHFRETHRTQPGNTGAEYGIDQTAVIWLAACQGVRLERNEVCGMGPFARRALAVAGDVQGLSGAETGVRFPPRPDSGEK